MSLPTPGIYPRMSRAEYEKIDAVNWSTLKHYQRSPRHARYAMDHPKPPSKAMEKGTAVHMAVLEPERFKDEYIILPKIDRRTKKGKAEWAEAEANLKPGQSFCEQGWYDYIRAVRDEIIKHPTITPLLSGVGLNEVCCVAKRNIDGVDVLTKSLHDRIKDLDGYTWNVDFKSCVSAEPWRFGPQACTLGYPGQAAFYTDNLDIAVPSEKERRFIFIAWESEAPYCPKVYELEDLEIGRTLTRRLLRLHVKCTKTNHWPGYPTEIDLLRLPDWYKEANT